MSSSTTDRANPLRWWPRREDGLPPGQRLLTSMPRFSDRPLRRPPSTPEDPSLTVAVDGEVRSRHPAATIAGQRVERSHDFHCVTGWSVRSLRWGGVALADLVDAADLPAFAVVSARDGAAAIFVTDDLVDERTLVATHLDGRPLDDRHGAPLRLVAPHLYGYKNVKHLERIEFVSDRPVSRLGPKEHLRARVDLEERHARLPSRLVRLPYRALVPITAALAERTLARARQDRTATPSHT